MTDYVCSKCGSPARYDGRCGDGPYLVCACVSNGHWHDDGQGGYMIYPGNPQPISAKEYILKKRPRESSHGHSS